jgi:peptidoglycan/xylan/chitin deacetylase (PgdA/CDA1 family)
MKRYHLVGILALFVGFLAFAKHSLWLGIADAGTFVIVFGLGVTCPKLSFFGPFVCRGNSEKNCVAITFDDGPDPESTPQLLELLHHRRVAVTFFCIGRKVVQHPLLAAQMFREGHQLENHSHTHSNGTNLFSVARLESELKQTQTAIQQATGVAPRFFRPPFGFSNPRIFRVAGSLGLTVVGWTVRGFDTADRNPERVVKRLARGLKPGAIILLHDGNIPPGRLIPTVKALLDIVHTSGYEVVRLDKLLT